MIVALAGRRIDAPDSDTPRFPSALVDTIRQKLIEFLDFTHATHLVSSGACGADLLAMQAATELAIDKTMILPFDAATFRDTSVTDRPGEWGIIYDGFIRDLGVAKQLVELNFSVDDPDVFVKTNFHILERAQKIAGKTYNIYEQQSQPASNLMALIVWEGTPRDADDNTYHFLLEANKRNFTINEILTIE